MRKNCSKVILENFFEPCVLYLLLKKPSYGYDLSRKLKENCGCRVNVGNLYRCLSRLQKDGCVAKTASKSETGPDRLVYAVTARGKNLLKEWIDELTVQNETIGKLITNYKKFNHVKTRPK